jgi:hypothetical protein
MKTNRVFIVGESHEDDRPQIRFDLPENSCCVDWLKTLEILDGKRDPNEYESPHLIARESDAVNWDYYRCAGTLGLISERAVCHLAQYGRQCFEFLEAYLNDKPFFLLRKIGTINALDREHSSFDFFPHDPTRIMSIDRYALDKSKINDPCLFIIPESGTRLFGTDSIEPLIHDNRLRGFHLVDAEQDTDP